MPGPATTVCCGSRPAVRFLTDHEAGIVTAATARLVPGPADDSTQQTPGAREADVVGYVDRLLSLDPCALDVANPVFLGGPWRRPGDLGELGELHAGLSAAPLSRPQQLGWSQRVRDLRRCYRAGLALLDDKAGGDFAAASPADQDAALLDAEVVPFREVLFEHTVEGMYSLPEYGGNRAERGWCGIGHHGETQPAGFAEDEVTGPGRPSDRLLLSALLRTLLEQHAHACTLVVGCDD